MASDYSAVYDLVTVGSIPAETRVSYRCCRLPLTVKHILMECTSLWDVRVKYFVVLSVEDLFESNDIHTIVDFIKETHFCNQL